MKSLTDLINEGEELEVLLDEEPNTMLLIDGDIVAYRPAAACDGRMYTVKDSVGVWKYKKDVVAHCNKEGLSLGDIQQEFNPEPFTHALAAVKMQMRSILMVLENRHEFVEHESYLTDSTLNFRLDINPDYKANRKGKRKPHHLNACKNYLIKEYGAKYCGDMEADDMIALRASQLRAEDKPYVVCSIDKDLNQIPGWHYDWVKDKYWFITDAEARESLWKQVVVGDTTDNIFSPEGIGPAKANKVFTNVDWETETDEELYRLVTGLYSEFLGKCGKAKKDKGILPVTDFTDVICWVKETMSQVYLLREEL